MGPQGFQAQAVEVMEPDPLPPLLCSGTVRPTQAKQEAGLAAGCQLRSSSQMAQQQKLSAEVESSNS